MEIIAKEELYHSKYHRIERLSLRFEDGDESSYDTIDKCDAVVVLAHQNDFLYMIRQPRPPVGEKDLLELPAGGIDKDGEGPLATAQRELAEEIGMKATDWKQLKIFYSSPGSISEKMYLFLAEDLEPMVAEPDPDERIEVEKVAIADLDQAINRCLDAKSLIGLLFFQKQLLTRPAN